MIAFHPQYYKIVYQLRTSILSVSFLFLLVHCWSLTFLELTVWSHSELRNSIMTRYRAVTIVRVSDTRNLLISKGEDLSYDGFF